MFFTREDYEKIERYLRANSKKDTDFKQVFETTLQDYLAIVQNNKNVKIQIKDFLDGVVKVGIPLTEENYNFNTGVITQHFRIGQVFYLNGKYYIAKVGGSNQRIADTSVFICNESGFDAIVSSVDILGHLSQELVDIDFSGLEGLENRVNALEEKIGSFDITVDIDGEPHSVFENTTLTEKVADTYQFLTVLIQKLALINGDLEKLQNHTDGAYGLAFVDQQGKILTSQLPSSMGETSRWI